MFSVEVLTAWRKVDTDSDRDLVNSRPRALREKRVEISDGELCDLWPQENCSTLSSSPRCLWRRAPQARRRASRADSDSGTGSVLVTESRGMVWVSSCMASRRRPPRMPGACWARCILSGMFCRAGYGKGHDCRLIPAFYLVSRGSLPCRGSV